MKWKTLPQSEKFAPGTTIVDGIWWRAMFLCSCLIFLCSCLIFLCKFLTFQLAEPKKQHTKNIGSIFMYMRVTIPGTPGNWLLPSKALVSNGMSSLATPQIICTHNVHEKPHSHLKAKSWTLKCELNTPMRNLSLRNSIQRFNLKITKIRL